jgi:cell division transport system permease protein
VIGALKYFFVEALYSLWRGRRASVLSILTIAVGLFVLGVFLVVTTNLQRLVRQWSSAAEFSVYLGDAVTEAETAAVVRAASAHPAVAKVDFVSKPDALRRFTRDFPELSAAARSSAGNPFPASLEVRLASATVDASSVEQLARSLARMPGVTDVRYDRRWIERLAAVADSVRWAGFALSAVLILAAALTIASVVRLALFARRDEIEIMELVGAPIAFIRGPFVCEGILQGAIGALVALVVLRIGFGLARASLDVLAELAGASASSFLPVSTMMLLLLGGAAVGCMGSLLAVRRGAAS